MLKCQEFLLQATKGSLILKLIIVYN